jgi:hypothetical protein
MSNVMHYQPANGELDSRSLFSLRSNKFSKGSDFIPKIWGDNPYPSDIFSYFPHEFEVTV